MPGLKFALNEAASQGKKPASALLLSIPSTPGAEREAAILDIVKEGHVPEFIQSWLPINVKHTGISGCYYVLPDFFSIGTDGDFLRVRIAPLTAEWIGDLIDGQLPTSKMVDDIYKAAPQRLSARPWGPPYDKSMMVTNRWPIQDERIQKQFDNREYLQGVLTAGHLKNVVVGKGLEGRPKKRGHDGVVHPAIAPGTRVGIYGWFKASGAPIQGPAPNFGTHIVSYADYSHGIRFVHKLMIVDGDSVPLTRVMKDAKLSPLVSNEGPLKHATYREVRG